MISWFHLKQGFSEYLGNLLRHRLPGPPLETQIQESAFLTGSQEVLMLWFCRPYLEEGAKTPGYFVNPAEILVHSIIFIWQILKNKM